MFRAIFELFVTILLAWVARAVITSLMKGVANASSGAFSQNRDNSQSRSTGQSQPADGATPASNAKRAGELHKDPVCGTYVTEASTFRRQAAGTTFYYCSAACREKHALVAR